MSGTDHDARSLFGLRKRAPKRPLTVTIILVFVIGLLLTSGPRDLDRDAAIRQTRAFIESSLPPQCGPISEIRNGRVQAVTTESGNLERFEVQQRVTLANEYILDVAVQVWPGIPIGPRVPLGTGGYFALFEFDDGVEFTGAKPMC